MAQITKRGAVLRILLQRHNRQYALAAAQVYRVVRASELAAQLASQGLQVGFVSGRPVMVTEPYDCLSQDAMGRSVSAETEQSSEPGPGAWVVVLQSNGDCHQAVFADEVDWMDKEEA